MTVPSYTTDLADIITADNNTNWFEMTGHTGGGADTAETDYFIQGAGCVSQSIGGKTGTQVGLEYRSGSDVTGFTDSTDLFFLWHVVLAGNAMDTFVNGGMRIYIGSSTGNVNGWKIGGSNFGRNPYGGWHNVVVDPQFTPDYVEGSPASSNYQIYCSLPNMTAAVSKGNLHAMDAIRWGRGELIIEHGEAASYGVFSGIATQNDAQANRWGLFQAEGTGYLWKGLLSFGNGTNVCDFRDTNKNITIDDTPRAYALFNKIEINNASSRVDWTNINITTLNASQLSIGSFEMTADATVNFTGCVFTDMGTFIFDSNATILNTTFRRCGQITQAGGIFTDCIFENSDAASTIISDSLVDISGCSFTSDGSNYATNLGTIAATASVTWANYLSGYASSNGSTGNEAIYCSVASSQTLTINVTSGYDTPSVHNAGTGSISVVNAVTVTVTVKDTSNNAVESAAVAVYKSSDDTQIMNELSAAGTGIASESFAYVSNTDVYIRVRKSTTGTRYIPVLTTGTITSSGLTLTVVLNKDSIVN